MQLIAINHIIKSICKPSCQSILHCKVAWEAVKPDNITKCFKISGVFDWDSLPPSTPEFKQEENGNANAEDMKFARYFQELLDVPWEEYLAMDNQLELENSVHAPDAIFYQDCVDDIPNEAPEEPLPKADELIKYLKLIQR